MDPTAKMGYGVALDAAGREKLLQLLRGRSRKPWNTLKDLRLRVEHVGGRESAARVLLLAEESFAEVLFCDAFASPDELLPDTGNISGRIEKFLAEFELLPLVYRPGSTQLMCSWFVGMYWS